MPCPAPEVDTQNTAELSVEPRSWEHESATGGPRLFRVVWSRGRHQLAMTTGRKDGVVVGRDWTYELDPTLTTKLDPTPTAA